MIRIVIGRNFEEHGRGYWYYSWEGDSGFRVTNGTLFYLDSVKEVLEHISKEIMEEIQEQGWNSLAE